MDTSCAVLQVDSESWSPAWKLAIERLREWWPSQDLTPRPGSPVAGPLDSEQPVGSDALSF